MRRLYRGRHEVFAAAFNPVDYNKHFGWVIVEDNKYMGQYMPEALRRDLNTLGYTEKLESLGRPETDTMALETKTESDNKDSKIE